LSSIERPVDWTLIEPVPTTQTFGECPEESMTWSRRDSPACPLERRHPAGAARLQRFALLVVLATPMIAPAQEQTPDERARQTEQPMKEKRSGCGCSASSASN
jgi:hypothetical protein